MSKHTAGPWKFQKIDHLTAVVESEHPEGDRHVCWVSNCDARLIAAAPDLLEALKDLVARCDGDEGVRADGSNIDTAWAHAVIAKAEGGDA